MALAERFEEDRVEIVGEHRVLQIRTARIIYDDATGAEITRSFHRETLAPDADVSGRSDLIRGVAGAAWTEEVRDRWASRSQPELPGSTTR